MKNPIALLTTTAALLLVLTATQTHGMTCHVQEKVQMDKAVPTHKEECEHPGEVCYAKRKDGDKLVEFYCGNGEHKLCQKAKEHPDSTKHMCSAVAWGGDTDTAARQTGDVCCCDTQNAKGTCSENFIEALTDMDKVRAVEAAKRKLNYKVNIAIFSTTAVLVMIEVLGILVVSVLLCSAHKERKRIKARLGHSTALQSMATMRT